MNTNEKISQAINEGENLIKDYHKGSLFGKIPAKFRGRDFELMSETKIAVHLLEVGAVTLRPNEPFVWSSGWKSPIYCDNRITLSYPEVRSMIKNAIVDAILSNFRDVDAIVGVSTAGIPQGALVAEEMGLPFLYVRNSPKEHGMGNLIEGHMEPGWKVVVIEDLVSTGTSSLKAVEAIREVGGNVIGMVSNFTYDFDIARKAFKDADVELVSITDYNVLIDIAKIIGLINEPDTKLLKAWRKDPVNWGK
jgi:orotate phosphoribosyltransferase